MDIAKKLGILADAAKYDASCSSSGSKKTRDGKGLGSTEGAGICHSYTPDGRCISLLKILLTNHCIFDCKYCVNRVTSDIPRARFTTKEVVDLTLDFYRRNYIEGLFLSSGIIKDSDYTMAQITEVARSLRQDHHFRGYIHLKTIPGAADELVREAGLYADRLSVNIELPTSGDLENLAPEKNRPQLERNMAEIQTKAREISEDRKKGMKAPVFAPAGQSTQMIVGATPTPDKEILKTSDFLYSKYKLRRVYYSAFSPIPHADARLPGKSPPLVREHRLYQADWMLRFYDFKIEDIVPDTAPDLSLDMDPKTSWALRNRAFFPVDVNRAPRESLLRIPGVGVTAVDHILRIRRHGKVRYMDLVRLKVAMNRAKHFIIAADYNPQPNVIDSTRLAAFFTPPPEQLALPI
ncbi:MAG: putative DNA modification/repair radical SAM protein [Micavibrio aeruginosavorus]|uniref:Putative DNA modification/repair radical SAM protein n=1 Tax=Micavibrio aeruginosavorus TaxID=349221 RepID=A0A2W5A8F7_9BACT|nr:MAG: putative DNA modification/repair radical SAM protein [Micavibrio aeruginosavorus]